MYVAADEDPQLVATTYGFPIVLARDVQKPVKLTDPIQGIATAGVSIIPLSCENCGIMRVMDVRPLVAWKLSKLNDASSDTGAHEASEEEADQ